MIEKYRKLSVQTKAAIWFVVCSFMQRGITAISTPIFTRLLNTYEYGQFSVFNSWLSVLTIIITLNLSAGVYTQGLVKFSKNKDVFSSSLQGLTALLCIAWTIIYLLFHDFWNNLLGLSTVQVLALIIMIWTTSVFNFWSAYQRVEYRYKSLVFITVIVSILKPIIGVLFVILADDKVTARILGLVLVETVFYPVLFYIQLKKGKKLFDKEFWKYAVIFNLPLVPHYLSQTVLNSADRIMIQQLIGDSESGVYSLAYNISQIMILFNIALSNSVSPWMYQKIKDKDFSEIPRISYITMIIVAILNLALIAIAPEVVNIFAPSSYEEAIYIIPPIAISLFFYYCYDLFAKFEFYYEKTNLIMVASVAGALLNVVLNAIFIPIYGYYAAGYTTLICYICYMLFHYWAMKYVCKKYMVVAKIFAEWVIFGLSVIVIVIGAILLFTYKYPFLRYSIIFIGLAIIFIKRKALVLLFKQMMRLKKNSND